MDRLATGTWKIFLNRADDGRKEVAMGQIANQMLLEWCHKMARKIGEKRKNRDVRKQRPEEAGKRSADSTAPAADAGEVTPESLEEDGICS